MRRDVRLDMDTIHPSTAHRIPTAHPTSTTSDKAHSTLDVTRTSIRKVIRDKRTLAADVGRTRVGTRGTLVGRHALGAHLVADVERVEKGDGVQLWQDHVKRNVREFQWSGFEYDCVDDDTEGGWKRGLPCHANQTVNHLRRALDTRLLLVQVQRRTSRDERVDGNGSNKVHERPLFDRSVLDESEVMNDEDGGDERNDHADDHDSADIPPLGEHPVSVDEEALDKCSDESGRQAGCIVPPISRDEHHGHVGIGKRGNDRVPDNGNVLGTLEET